jgi:hypothetical protein
MTDRLPGREAIAGPMPYIRASGIPDNDRDGLVLLLLTIPIIGATFLSKFALPYVKVDGIGLGFPLIYLPLLLGLFIAGRLQLEPARLLFFCVMASVMGGVMLLRGEDISLLSVAFLMMLHLPYVAHISAGDRVMESLRRVFLNVATAIALCGLAQYVLQSHLARAYIFPLENFLPSNWLVTGFNMQAPIAYGSSIYRPNGIFMQEPSFFSQLLAIATLIELVGARRLWRIALFVIAIFASQSGTGLVLLAVCVPVLILVSGRWSLIISAAVVLSLLLLAGQYLHIDQFMARIGEFGSERSSAYERFVGGFYIFDASVGADPLRMLFGYGAGTYRDIVSSLNHPAAEMALFKIVVEYGLVGTLLYFGFMFFCIFSAQGPFVLRLALAVCLFLNGAYNSFVHSLALSLLVWPSSSSVEGSDALTFGNKGSEWTTLDSVKRPSTARTSW